MFTSVNAAADPPAVELLMYQTAEFSTAEIQITRQIWRKTHNITQKSIKYNTGKDLNLRPSAIPLTIYLCLFLLPTRTDAMRSSGTGTGGQLSISAKTPSAFQLFRQFHLPPLEKDNFRLYSIYRTVCAFLPAVASLSVKYTVCPTFSGILIKNF